MSNKVIVFYTGELKEVQENSLRQAHDIENIIFVPIETLADLETHLLETTEQPFTVYNYLTDPELILTLCDKVLQFTKQTGYKPEYFFWLEGINTNHRKENIKMSINKSRVFVITEASLAKSLNLQKEEINESIDVISLNIPAISEEHVKQVFDDKVFRGYTKPTFVLIDDRHKYADLIVTLTKGMNVYGNINVKVVDMRDLTLMEILKKQSDLEIQNRFEEMKATQLASLELQYNKPGEIHVDVTGVPMPDPVKQIIDRLKPKPVTHVMSSESFLISGLVLGNVAPWGFEFHNVPNVHIYTSNEDRILTWFNTFILNTVNSKREFPLLKAVIYNFDNVIQELDVGVTSIRDIRFIEHHITSALEIFGPTEDIKFFHVSEIAQFTEYVKLTDEELRERKALMIANSARQHIASNGSHTYTRIAERLKAKATERDDPYLSYGEAIEMCKLGIDIACVNWKADEFLTVNTGTTVHADKFWSNGNKRAAMARLDQSLSVFPHTLRTTSYGTVPHMVDFNDQFSEWVVASDRIKVRRAVINSDEGLSKLTLHYALDTLSTPDFELAPFWIVYDVLAKFPSRVTVLSDNPKSDLPHIIGSMKEAHDYRRQIVEESYNIGEDGIDDNAYSFRGVEFLCSVGLNETIKRIEAGELKDVILDDDSFKTDFYLDKVKEALQKANVNWVTVSVKEQLFGITE